MDVFHKSLEIHTSLRMELVDITRQVDEVVSLSGLQEGLVNIYTQHSTSAVAINENETGLLHDFQVLLEKLAPSGAGYEHDRIDNNADSHLRGFLLGSSETLPFRNGRMMLGTWQSIFFVELDGPRQRKVNLSIIGK